MRRRLRGLVLRVTCVLAAFLGCVLTVAARDAAASSWSTVQPMLATASLASTSCVSVGDCVAVGSMQNTFGFTVAVSEVWNGSSWTLVPVPVPPNAQSTALASVSCVPSGQCMAVGNADGQPLADLWDGSQWVLEPPQTFTNSSALVGVSCVSASRCVAVGAGTGVGGGSTVLVEVWDGTGWAVQSAPDQAGALSTTLSAVSCPSANACVAVGASQASTTAPDQAVAESWDGSQWVLQSLPAPSGATLTSLDAVSCASTSDCMAVGDSWSPGSQESPLSEHWTGSGWAAGNLGVPAGASGGILTSVACPSVGTCTAVGWSMGGASNGMFSEDWQAGGWSVTSIPTPAGASNAYLFALACPVAGECLATGMALGTVLLERAGGGWSELPAPDTIPARNDMQGVSCDAGTDCAAVGWFSPSAGVIEPMAGHWDGASWRLDTVQPVTGAGSSELVGVACSSATMCMAVGDDGPGGIPNPTQDLTEVWNGADWVIVPAPALGASSTGLKGVSCPAPNQCVAVGYADSSALALGWDGTSWTAETLPGEPGATAAELTGVSCLSASDCTAVGWVANQSSTLPLILHWDGTSWSAMTPATPAGAASASLSGVSCVAATSCVAVGSTGWSSPLAEIWNGSTWTITSVPAALNGSTAPLTGVSCMSSSECTAVGDGQVGWDGSAWRAILWNAGEPLASAACVPTAGCIVVGTEDIGGGGFSYYGVGTTGFWGGFAPVNASPPAIKGVPQVGQTLSFAHGTWLYQPVRNFDTWERCDASGGSCVFVPGWGPTFLVTGADIGHTIRLQESASNRGGLTVAQSAPLGPIVAQTSAPPPPALPHFSRLRLSAGRFRTAAPARSRRRVPRGTVITFSLNEAARVTVTVEQLEPGWSVGAGRERRCVRPARRTRRRDCTRVVHLRGRITVWTPGGRTRIRFTGRLGGRVLPPGSYRLVLTATTSNGGSESVTARFTVVAG